MSSKKKPRVSKKQKAPVLKTRKVNDSAVIILTPVLLNNICLRLKTALEREIQNVMMEYTQKTKPRRKKKQI